MKREFTMAGEGGVKKLKFSAKIDSSGDFTVGVEEEDGTEWAILYIDACTGKLVLYNAIDDDIGLAVDSDGKMELKD
jgi:hypothetical protein